MALQTPNPAPMAANPGGPSRLHVRWRRLGLVLWRDPLAAPTSPPVAIRLADDLLSRTAVARRDTEIW